VSSQWPIGPSSSMVSVDRLTPTKQISHLDLLQKAGTVKLSHPLWLIQSGGNQIYQTETPAGSR